LSYLKTDSAALVTGFTEHRQNGPVDVSY